MCVGLYVSMCGCYLCMQEAEEDLQSVLPDLKAAEKGLNSLKKSDLTEIRSAAVHVHLICMHSDSFEGYASH